MFGINEILDKVIFKDELTEDEKFKILSSKRVDTKVLEYLIIKLNNLYIDILGKSKGTLFELMNERKLINWCWQTTESAIVFLNDDDYIERGNLRFDENTPLYYHSWICFNFNNIEYILDPCLNLLCKKSDYSKIFKTQVIAKITALNVREELIRQVTTLKKDVNSTSNQPLKSFLQTYMKDYYDYYVATKKDEVIVYNPEDVNAPLYRNGAGYKLEVEEGRIKKLIVHYYRSDC